MSGVGEMCVVLQEYAWANADLARAALSVRGRAEYQRKSSLLYAADRLLRGVEETPDAAELRRFREREPLLRLVLDTLDNAPSSELYVDDGNGFVESVDQVVENLLAFEVSR